MLLLHIVVAGVSLPVSEFTLSSCHLECVCVCVNLRVTETYHLVNTSFVRAFMRFHMILYTITMFICCHFIRQLNYRSSLPHTSNTVSSLRFNRCPTDPSFLFTDLHPSQCRASAEVGLRADWSTQIQRRVEPADAKSWVVCSGGLHTLRLPRQQPGRGDPSAQTSRAL